MKITFSRNWHPGSRLPGVKDYGNYGGDIVIRSAHRWLRLALYVGSPPGSHIGIWRTSWGDLNGLNLRVGRRHIGPCLTAFAHTRREWPAEQPDGGAR